MYRIQKKKGLREMNFDILELITPSNEYKEQVMEYRKIFLENEESFDGCAGLEECNTYEEWLDWRKLCSIRCIFRG